MEHDACGVGMIASTNGKKSRKIVDYGIEALKAIWHRGAVDADGKSGDGAGIQIEIAPDFFKEKRYPPFDKPPLNILPITKFPDKFVWKDKNVKYLTFFSVGSSCSLYCCCFMLLLMLLKR